MTPYNEYITSIVTAIIVYFSAFSLIFKEMLSKPIGLNFYKNKKIKKYKISEEAK